MKAIKHFNTITKHKFKVMSLCFKVGLYKQGLLHDLSKYMPCEFMSGVHYYQGYKSPNSAEREEKGYSLAWLHHKGANKHHWEFWVDFTRDGVKPSKMPFQYVLEMFCDRVAASMIYQGKNYSDHYPLIYYNNGKNHYYMHEDTKKLLEHLLTYLDEHQLSSTIHYINSNKKELENKYKEGLL